MLRLRRQSSFTVAYRRRKVTAGVQDLRVGRAQHGFAHLLDDGFEAELQN